MEEEEDKEEATRRGKNRRNKSGSHFAKTKPVSVLRHQLVLVGDSRIPRLLFTHQSLLRQAGHGGKRPTVAVDEEIRNLPKAFNSLGRLTVQEMKCKRIPLYWN